MDARAHIQAPCVTSSFHALSQAPEARDLDWEDYNSELDKGEGSGSHAENPWGDLLAGIPNFNTEEWEALLHDLPIPDAANQASKTLMMTMA